MTPDGAVLTLEWTGSIVALSIGIAFIGSYATVTLYEQYRLCSRENQPKLMTPSLLLWLMALSLGGIAIWTMHFAAMSSITLRDDDGNILPVYYRLDYTFISLIAVIFLSYAGLRVGSSDQLFKSDKNDVVTKFANDARNMTIREIKAIRNIRIFLLSTLVRKHA